MARARGAVALVWEKESGGCRNDNSHNSDDDDDKKVSWRISLQNVDSEANGNSQNDNEDDEEEVVDIAWQLERQRRKVQHSQKVGQPIGKLDICYEDEHVVIVNKPSGVLTVPGVRQHPSLLDAVHAHASPLDKLKCATHRIVHRLDMDTSGIVLFGRSLEVTKQLQSMFATRQGVRKGYRAVVVGHFPVDAGIIDLPLQRDIEHAPFMRISTPSYDQRAKRHLESLHAMGKKKQWTYAAAKPSYTRFSVLRRGWFSASHGVAAKEQSVDDTCLPFSVLQLEPITGRTHQLRVHCAALGFPILGDPTYGWLGEAASFGGLSSVSERTKPAVPVDILKAWNEIYRPNEAPMCLHATSLELELPLGHLDVNRRISCQTEALFEPRFSF